MQERNSLSVRYMGRPFAPAHLSQHPRTSVGKRPLDYYYYRKSGGHRKHGTRHLRIPVGERPLGYHALKKSQPRLRPQAVSLSCFRIISKNRAEGAEEEKRKKKKWAHSLPHTSLKARHMKICICFFLWGCLKASGALPFPLSFISVFTYVQWQESWAVENSSIKSCWKPSLWQNVVSSLDDQKSLWEIWRLKSWNTGSL